MRELATAALIMLLGCGEGNPLVAPHLDLPPADSGAYPFDGVDELRLSVALAGHEQSLVEKTVPFGEPMTLDEIPFASDLVVHLRGLRGSSEVSYGRTCAFDATADSAAGINPWLYFSRIVAWGPGPLSGDSIDPERSGGHALVTADGRAVFVAGGLDAVTMMRFDPVASGELTPLAGQTMPRIGATLSAIGEEQWLLVGGVDDDDPATADAIGVVEVIDPRPELPPQLQVTTVVGPRLRAHAAASLVDGTVLVAGGESQSVDGGPFEVTGEAWLFRRGDGDTIELTAPAAELMTPRRDQTMTRLGNELGADILIVGGRDAAGQAIGSAELFRPLRQTFEEVADGQLATPRWSHVAVRMPGGFVLILGGLTDNPGGDPLPVADLEIYDPIQGRFSHAGTLPATAGLVGQSVTPMPDGRVLLVGGRDAAGQRVTTTLIARLDPLNGLVTVSQTDSLQSPRADHSAVSLCDGTIMVVGGSGSAGATGAERYNPPAQGRQ